MSGLVSPVHSINNHPAEFVLFGIVGWVEFKSTYSWKHKIEAQYKIFIKETFNFFFFTFPLHSQCEDYIFLRYISPLCCERFHIYAFAVSSCIFEFKSQQLVRRSSQPHGSSQIISSTPLLLTTACAWNVSVPLENTVGAHPRGWVGSSCLHHNSEQKSC